MKVPHEKDVAIHSTPSFAPGVARRSVKRKQGNWAGRRRAKLCDSSPTSKTRLSAVELAHSSLGPDELEYCFLGSHRDAGKNVGALGDDGNARIARQRGE